MYDFGRVVTEDTLGDIHPGDLNMGAGVSTSQLANPNVPITEPELEATKDARVGRQHSLIMESPGIWAVAIVLLILTKIVAEGAGNKAEFATVRIGLENLFVVGTMAAIWFFILKGSAALISGNNWFTAAFKQFAGLI